MKSLALPFYRLRFLQAPVSLLILLLQRTPVLRVVLQSESAFESGVGDVVKSAFALSALGAYHSLSGATTFSVTSSTGTATGSANSTFNISGTVGTPINGSVGVTFSVSGAPGTPKSFGVTDNIATYNYSNTLPPGLTLNPQTGTVAGGGLYYNGSLKGTITGTPTSAGTYSVALWATNSTALGGSGGAIRATFTITGGSTAVAPSFTTQPSSQTVTAGTSVTFSSAASGTPAPTYQWYVGGSAISGATSSSYTISSAQSSNSGSYTVVATNSAGSVTSSAATLTVNAATSAPSFTTQPSSQSVTAGASVSFSAAASGNPTPTYQWYVGGVPISGATSSTYTIASAQTSNSGSYTVVATNSAGSVTSNAATLTVNAANTAPVFTSQPLTQVVGAGSSVSFSAAASGNPTPTYQWYLGGVPITGATSTTYTIASAQSSNAGTYTVVATNSAGSVTSAAATLTVNSSLPVLGSTTTSEVVYSGHSASFYASVTSGGTVTYQWQVSTDGGSTWTTVTNNSTYAGATTNTLTVTTSGTGQNGSQFRVAVTNSAGSVTSSPYTLSVKAVVFPSPKGVTVDSSGNVWVADSSLNVIEEVNSSGVATVIAGTSGQQGSTDGTGGGRGFERQSLRCRHRQFAHQEGHSLGGGDDPCGLLLKPGLQGRHG